MADYDIHKIIRKYFSGKVSKEELACLEEWLNKETHNQEVFETLKQVWQEKSSEPELVTSEASIDKIWKEAMGANQVRQNIDWNYYLKVAAIILLFITAPIFTYQFIKRPILEVMSENVVKENPAGEKSKIYLPDGSIVYLNSASIIEYNPQKYNDSIRLLTLEGEAFFEVVSNPAKPFVVQSGDLRTSATGTSFNIEAYPGQNSIRVSLISGVVTVLDIEKPAQELTVNPGYQVVYNTRVRLMSNQKADLETVTGWKEGLLIYDKARYAEVIEKLERWYGVSITTTGQPPLDWRLTTIYDDQSLVNILKNMRFGKAFNYELNNDELIIKFE